jgi:hypothetical protein
MCMVSAMSEDFLKHWPHDNWPLPLPPTPAPWPPTIPMYDPEDLPATTRDLNKLRAELEALKKLIPAAEQYDRDTGQEACEHDDKVRLILELAELAGVDMEDVLRLKNEGGVDKE